MAQRQRGRGMVLVAGLLATQSTACVWTTVTGKVTDCRTGQPLEGVHIKAFEAPNDPNVTEFDATANWYRGQTKQDGSFSIATASSEKSAWALKTKHEGYAETVVRADVDNPQKDYCLKPK